MENPIIFNEIDFEENIYDFFKYLMYKGAPFTGTLIYDTAKIEFKDGNAHGRSLDYYDNGQIAEDSIYENGEWQEGKEWYKNGQIKFDSIGKKWYENGQLKHDSTGVDSLFWGSDGKLAKINESWLYKNGKKINGKDNEGNYLTFSSTGEVAVKQSPNPKSEETPIVYYYHNVLSKCYEELLDNIYPELNTNFQFTIYFIFGWVGKVHSLDKTQGQLLIQKLMQHKYEKTKEFADYFNFLATKKENGERTYWLEDNPNHIIL